MYALFLALLISIAFAGEPPTMTLTVPTVGATTVIQNCTTNMVAAPWNTKNAGRLAIDLATAQEICMSAQGDLEIAKARAKAIIARAKAEAKLIEGAADLVKAGGSASYSSDPDGRVDLATGTSADWREYGETLAHNPSALGAGGAYDPQFVQPFVLDQARAGFMAHPAVPGGTMVASVAEETADCGTPVECDNKVRRLSDALALEE